MKTIEPNLNNSVASRLLRLIPRPQSVVIGTILLIATTGAAQSVNKTRKGYDTQTSSRNPDLKSLDRLVGTWKISDPTGKREISGHVTYEWMEGGFFLMQTFDFVHNGRKVKGIEVIGHEQQFGAAPGKEIKSRVYDNAGNTLDYVYELEKYTLTIWGGQKGSPAYFKGKFSADNNSCTGGWVYPGGGGYQATMTRVKN